MGYIVSLPKKALLEHFFSFLLKNSVFCNLQSRMNSFLGLCLAAMTIACVWFGSSTTACNAPPKKCYTDKFCLCGGCDRNQGAFLTPWTYMSSITVGARGVKRDIYVVYNCWCEKWRRGVERPKKWPLQVFESKCKCN